MASAGINSSYLRYVPLWTPALEEENPCKKDFGLEGSRMVIVMATTMAVFFSTLVLLPTFPVLPFLTLGAILVFPLDIWLTERAADRNAVEEYSTNDHPSQHAFSRIAGNLSAVQLLVGRGIDLNKTSETGSRLLEVVYRDFDVFKYFIDHGADVHLSSRSGPLLNRVVQMGDSKFLQYVLEKKKVQINRFTNDEQVQLWLNFKSLKCGRLLKDYGFDINVQDQFGRTPLWKLVQNASTCWISSFDGPGPREYVNMLLQYGANPLLTAQEMGMGQQKNAVQINTNPAIAAVFDRFFPPTDQQRAAASGVPSSSGDRKGSDRQ